MNNGINKRVYSPSSPSAQQSLSAAVGKVGGNPNQNKAIGASYKDKQGKNNLFKALTLKPIK